MTRELSLYLDVVRLSAACLVVLSHTNLRILTARMTAGSDLGHPAVIVFFVLSGFVISYVTATRETRARDYAVSRIARIYSVAIPALLLTVLLDAIGERLTPSVYAGLTTHGLTSVRLVGSLALLNECWVSIQAFSNTPYWSISYEGWYYILFGLFVFWRGKGRTAVIAAAAAIAGPKILLLLPVWLLGVYLHRSAVWTRLTLGPALGLYLASWAGLAAFVLLGGSEFFGQVLEHVIGRRWLLDLVYSSGFLGDYVLGILVAANFASFRAAGALLGRWLVPFDSPIRVAAGFTLSVYLFHRPLILFFIAVIHGDPARSSFLVLVLALTLTVCVLLGLGTERQKHLARRLAVGLIKPFSAGG